VVAGPLFGSTDRAYLEKIPCSTQSDCQIHAKVWKPPQKLAWWTNPVNARATMARPSVGAHLSAWLGTGPEPLTGRQ